MLWAFIQAPATAAVPSSAAGRPELTRPELQCRNAHALEGNTASEGSEMVL